MTPHKRYRLEQRWRCEQELPIRPVVIVRRRRKLIKPLLPPRPILVGSEAEVDKLADRLGS